MQSPILTIAIPTYNRSDCLALLLDTLCAEFTQHPALNPLVHVLVLDNASTDQTLTVARAYADRLQHLEVIKHPENGGADANILSTIHYSSSDHVWIMGDDDLPMSGLLSKIIDFLQASTPALLYLPAKFINGPLNNRMESIQSEFGFTTGSARALLIQSTYSVTFISSWIFHRKAYLEAGKNNAEDLLGSNLVQLDWIYSLLSGSGRFCWTTETCVLARAGNTGGYSILNTFCNNLPRLSAQMLPPDFSALIRHSTLHNLLPGMIWQTRTGSLGLFSDESTPQIVENITEHFGSGWFVSWVLMPILIWPTRMTLLPLIFWKIYKRRPFR